MTAEEVRRALSRIAHELLERNRGGRDLVLVGIRTRGVPLAQRCWRTGLPPTLTNASTPRVPCNGPGDYYPGQKKNS